MKRKLYILILLMAVVGFIIIGLMLMPRKAETRMGKYELSFQNAISNSTLTAIYNNGSLKPDIYYLRLFYPESQRMNCSGSWVEAGKICDETMSIQESSDQLARLIVCESSGNPDAVGDSGKAKGILQFHLETFKFYVRKYNLLPDTEDAELENLWTDSQIQIELYKRIIKEPDGYKNWWNCLQPFYKGR